jgi:hypothetical protein
VLRSLSERQPEHEALREKDSEVSLVFEAWNHESEIALENTLTQIAALNLRERSSLRDEEVNPIEAAIQEVATPHRMIVARSSLFQRRLPGFLYLDEKQVAYLNTIQNREYQTVVQELDRGDTMDSAAVGLAVALVAALSGDWRDSERLAMRAALRARDEQDLALEREARYWTALSMRHRVHPGIDKFSEAAGMLREILPVETDLIKKLRIRSELTALDLSIYYHQYYYRTSRSDNYGKAQVDISNVFDELRALARDFLSMVRNPYDAVTARLGTQIFSNIALVALLSFGVPPGLPSGLAWKADQFPPRYLTTFGEILSSRRRTNRGYSAYVDLLHQAQTLILSEESYRKRERLLKDLRSTFGIPENGSINPIRSAEVP